MQSVCGNKVEGLAQNEKSHPKVALAYPVERVI